MLPEDSLVHITYICQESNPDRTHDNPARYHCTIDGIDQVIY